MDGDERREGEETDLGAEESESEDGVIQVERRAEGAMGFHPADLNWGERVGYGF